MTGFKNMFCGLILTLALISMFILMVCDEIAVKL